MIQLKNLTIGYGASLLLQQVSAEVKGGQLVALLGRNGAGKSTLLRTLMGLERPLSGHVLVLQSDLQQTGLVERAHLISLVTTAKLQVPNLRCRDVVAWGRSPYTGWMGTLSATDEEAVAEAVALTGVEAYCDKYIDCISDGEYQRVMIARALAQDTPVILLDEPTAFLDLPNKYELCLLLSRLAAERGKCIIFSTHDLDIALSLCDSIMLIDNPRLYVQPTAQMVCEGHIERLFRNASVTFDSRERRVHLVSGRPSSTL